MKTVLKRYGKKLIFIAVAVYAICTFISQQQTLNAYSAEVTSYQEKIAKQEETKTSLTEMKENVNSPEYIEKIAREKLGMYLPNEKVYIDVTK